MVVQFRDNWTIYLRYSFLIIQAAIYFTTKSTTVRLSLISTLLIYFMSLFDFQLTPACLCLLAILHVLTIGFCISIAEDLSLHKTNFEKYYICILLLKLHFSRLFFQYMHFLFKSIKIFNRKCPTNKFG